MTDRQEEPATATKEAEMMTDEQRGVYGKYRVERLGGTPGKHDDCWYYVLDLKHDKFTIPALTAYIEACRGEFPELASDLADILEGADPWTASDG